MPACRFGDPHCLDCDVNTLEVGEIYVVQDSVWPIARDAGMLCVGCLEDRLGRRLVPEDFGDLPINTDNVGRSERLRSRMTHDVPCWPFIGRQRRNPRLGA